MSSLTAASSAPLQTTTTPDSETRTRASPTPREQERICSNCVSPAGVSSFFAGDKRVLEFEQGTELRAEVKIVQKRFLLVANVDKSRV